MLTELEVIEAVAERCGRDEASRETILSALLSDDEADLIICPRREREEEELPWWGVVRESLAAPDDAGDRQAAGRDRTSGSIAAGEC